MSTVNPSDEQLARLEHDPVDDAPIVMLNLLRFRDVADYDAGGPRGVTGRAAYATYGKAVLPLLMEVGGRPLWRGDGRLTVIAPATESWDEALLVRYPSRRAFMRMVRSPAYQAIVHHRTAALSDSRLIELRPGTLPAWLLRGLGFLARARARFAPRVRAQP